MFGLGDGFEFEAGGAGDDLAVEAGVEAVMAGGAPLADLDDDGILVAIGEDSNDFLGISGFLAFDPEFLAGARPVGGVAGGEGAFEGLLIHEGDHEDFMGIGIDGDGGDESGGVEFKGEGGAEFGFFGSGHGEGLLFGKGSKYSIERGCGGMGARGWGWDGERYNEGMSDDVRKMDGGLPEKEGEGEAIIEEAKGRRGFFGEALRGAMGPLTGMIEGKINPVLEALEDLPRRAEEMSQMKLGGLDQIEFSLPVIGSGGGSESPRRGGMPERYLRPPGAMETGLDGLGFETVCSRCGKCVEACPAEAVKLDAVGFVAEGFPYIVASERACVVCDSLACMKSCPTGALKLVDRLAIRMGVAKVNHEVCLRKHGEDCRLCLEACPIGSAAIGVSERTGRVIVKKNGCVGCGLCEERCPTEPQAIWVEMMRGGGEVIVA